MQLTSVPSSGVASGKTRGGEGVRSLPGVRPEVVADVPAVPVAEVAAPLPRGGLRSWNTQLNQQLAGAQQAVEFLDEATSQLQGLKSDLSGKLVGREPQNGPLQEQVQQFQRTWRNRRVASGGALDPQLKYSGNEPARQRFTVRGLDIPALRSGEKETLSFAFTGATQRGIPVALEPGLTEAGAVQRIDQALASSNVRAEKDADGHLVLSTPEADWPAVRDSLSIKGGGIRFPTGQFHRVRTDTQPEVLQPQSWKVDDAGSMRQTLQQVLHAMQAVRDARGTVDGALADAGQKLQDSQPDASVGWARDFVQAFDALTKTPGYQASSSVAAALVGVRRDRVLSILSLR